MLTVGGVLVEKLKIKSADLDYSVSFLKTQKELKSLINKENYFFIIDDFVAKNYSLINQQFKNNIITTIKPDEKIKTLDTVKDICNELIKKGANRTSTIVGIGGGFVQDLSQFTSKIFHRGTKLTLVPTTLLSISDSCIGGKCGINLGSYKNQVGVFKSPSDVLIFSKFIKTLSHSQLVDGYGEILKLLITKNKKNTLSFLKYLNSNTDSNLDFFIKQSLISKKKIIEIDEFENDLRRILNYGHTFAHALESLSKNEISHGQAVGFGINIANFISMKLGLLEEKMFVNIFKNSYKTFYIEKIFENYQFGGDEYLKVMLTDKKTENNFTNFILCKDYGELTIKKLKLDNKIANLIDEFYSLDV